MREDFRCQIINPVKYNKLTLSEDSTSDSPQWFDATNHLSIPTDPMSSCWMQMALNCDIL